MARKRCAFSGTWNIRSRREIRLSGPRRQGTLFEVDVFSPEMYVWDAFSGIILLNGLFKDTT